MPQLPLHTDARRVPQPNDECHGLALVAHLEVQLAFAQADPADAPVMRPERD